MTFTTAPASPLPLDGIFSAVKLTPSELSQVRAVQSKIAAIWSIATEYSPSRENHRGETPPTASQTALDRSICEFRENPTAEGAAKYFAAVRHHSEVQAHGGHIIAACRAAVDNSAKTLSDVVRAVGQRAVAGLDQAVADRIATTAKSNVLLDVGSEAREWEERIVATRQALEREITEGVNNPIEFLLGRDLVPDDHPEQPAAPVPPAKPFRGKVAMPAKVTEPEPSVIEQLASDGDDNPDADPLDLLTGGN